MQQISEEKSSSGSAKDLSVQINYLNDLLEKGAISEEEYDRRAERLRHVGEVIGAVTNGNNTELESIIKLHPNLDLNNVSERNATILHLAITSAIKGRAGADIVQTLLGAGLQVDPVLNGFTPLLRVCDAAPFTAAADIAKALIKHGANVNFAAKQANQKHHTPLAAAVVRNHSAALVQALCEAVADVSIELEDGSALFHAVLYEQNEIAKILLNHRANPNVREPEKGATPLASAVTNGSLELVKALLAGGADKTLSIMNGQKAVPKDLAAQLVKANPADSNYQQMVTLLQ